jgi:hypothetical protein
MRLVRAEFHLELDGLWVAGSSLSGTATFVRDGFTVQIDLPADRAAFALLPRYTFPRGAFGGHSSGTGATSVQEVDIIRVSVTGPLDLRAEDFGAPGSVPNRDAMDHVRILVPARDRPFEAQEDADRQPEQARRGVSFQAVRSVTQL